MTAARLLSPMALDFLWEALGEAELPYPFQARSHGMTLDERGQLRLRMREELREHGLLDAGGRLAADVEHWLGLLATGARSIDSVFLPGSAGDLAPALAVGETGRAVLAVQDGSGLALRPIDPGGLASAVVGLLPRVPRGAEPSITLPAAELAELATGRIPGRSVTDRQVLTALSGQRKLRAGQFAANARNRLGGRVRSAVLSWFDTESGRYLTYASKGRDGQDWATIAPADDATLRHRLNQLLHQVGEQVNAPAGRRWSAPLRRAATEA